MPAKVNGLATVCTHLDKVKNHSPSFELGHIRGHLLELAQDQHGSRFIQQKLDNADEETKQFVFDEILPEIDLLMDDVYGNYVVQKFFELGSDEQKVFLMDKLQGHVLHLSLKVYGCRVVQKALEVLPIEQQVYNYYTYIHKQAYKVLIYNDCVSLGRYYSILGVTNYNCVCCWKPITAWPLAKLLLFLLYVLLYTGRLR